MSELSAADQWIYDTLTGNLTGIGDRIFDTVISQDAAYPLVLFQQMPSEDIMGVGPVRFMSRIEYSIRVVTEGTSFSVIETPAEEMDVLLHGQSGSNSFGTVLACVRVHPLKYVDIVNTKRILYLGGLYRLDTQKS